MRRLAIVAVFVWPALARADIVPDNTKGAATYVMVEASVPADRVLVVVNTSDLITPVVPGMPTLANQSKREGPMYLKLLAASDVPTPIPDWGERGYEQLREVRSLGQTCSGSFVGDRLYPDRTPADAVWFHFVVTITGDTCDGVLVAKDYRNRAGEVVEPGDLTVSWGSWEDNNPNWPAPDGKDLLRIPEPAKVVPREPKPFPTPREVRRLLPPPGDTPAALRPYGCGCAAGAEAGATWLIALFGLRRRRSRLSEGTAPQRPAERGENGAAER